MNGNLSPEAQARIKDWQENYRVNRDRISWDEKWIAQAFLNAKRSHDGQTRCGAVIVNRDNVLISEGYNGFIRGVDDSVLPNIRKDRAKYPYFIHAEENALLNAVREGRSTNGAKCYITGVPCITCFQHLWQAGVNEIITANSSINMIENDSEYMLQREILEYLIHQSGQYFVVRHLDFDETILDCLSDC